MSFVSFCGRALRVVTLSDLGRLSAQATLFPQGECDLAPLLHFADQPRVTGKVGPELLLPPLCWESTLTTGLSPLEFPETHTTELCHWHLCNPRLLDTGVGYGM